MNRLRFPMHLAAGLLIALAGSLNAMADETRLIGVDSNYVLEMRQNYRTWKQHDRPVDPYDLFAHVGCGNARVRLWVGDEGPSRLAYATQSALRAQKAGLKPCLAILLSDDWADLVKQPVPAIWKNLSADQKPAAVKAYCEAVVLHLIENKIDVDTFEIGNEIDFGICGEFEEQWSRRVSVDYMRARVWPRTALILKAAQEGVLKGRPAAKFIVHLAEWNNPDYCIAFWKAMLAAGVRVDFPGLSYYPSSASVATERTLNYLQEQVGRKIVDQLHEPVLICETAYPASDHFAGQFSDWKFPVDGYPLTDDGQARWLAELLSVVRSDPNFAGLFYFSPEWYDRDIWSAFALFNAEGVARPGVNSFKQRRLTGESG